MRSASAAVLVLFFAASLAAGCAGGAGASTPCDGIDERRFGITREEYGPCAAAILAALDTVEAQLRRVVSGDSTALPEARTSLRRLRGLTSRVDFGADARSEVRRQGVSGTIERWPNGAMRAFNAAVIGAEAYFRSTLAYPSADQLQQGMRHHADARQAHGRFR